MTSKQFKSRFEGSEEIKILREDAPTEIAGKMPIFFHRIPHTESFNILLNRWAKDYKAAEDIKKLQEVIKELETAKNYYEGMEIRTCCSGHECGCQGMPIDPEYYILQDILKILEVSKEITNAE